MKKVAIIIIIILVFTSGIGTGTVIQTEIVQRNISYIDTSYKSFSRKYPLLSYNDNTYISVRDMANMFSKNIRWEEKYNKIVIDSLKINNINKIETAEAIANALFQEFYAEKINDKTQVCISSIGKGLEFDDTYCLFAVFNPMDGVNIDDSYIKENADIKIEISKYDGNFSITEMYIENSERMSETLDLRQLTFD